MLRWSRRPLKGACCCHPARSRLVPGPSGPLTSLQAVSYDSRTSGLTLIPSEPPMTSLINSFLFPETEALQRGIPPTRPEL